MFLRPPLFFVLNQMSIHVRILDHTAKPLQSIYAAARTCYSSETPQAIHRSKPERAKMETLVRKTIEAGHHSVLEHAIFVFALSGVSRACSHQLVRHRVASFSQQSQRYVRASKPDYVTPPSIAASKPLHQEYQRAIDNLFALYGRFTAQGIPNEDARFLLPNAAVTHLVMSMNLRELIHVSALRLCTNSQWEIRNLFRAVKEALARLDPFLGSLLQPRCEDLGYCPEMHCCGRFPRKADVLGTKS